MLILTIREFLVEVGYVQSGWRMSGLSLWTWSAVAQSVRVSHERCRPKVQR